VPSITNAVYGTYKLVSHKKGLQSNRLTASLFIKHKKFMQENTEFIIALI